jgi:hypothetical protein
MDKILNNNYCEKEREIQTSRSNESAGAGELRQTKQPPGFPARFTPAARPGMFIQHAKTEPRRTKRPSNREGGDHTWISALWGCDFTCWIFGLRNPDRRGLKDKAKNVIF